MHSHLLTIKDVAERLSVKVSTVRYLRHTGRGPVPIKIGNLLRWTEESVKDYIEMLLHEAGVPR